MRLTTLALFTTFLYQILAQIYEDDGPVRQVTYPELNTATNDHPDKFTLVKYYTPWCSHCKTLKPVYEQLAAVLEPLNKTLQLLEIDCEESYCDVEGYPMLRLFKPLDKQAWNELQEDIHRRNVTWHESNFVVKGWLFMKHLFGGDPVKKVSPTRIIEYEGSRDLVTLLNWLSIQIGFDLVDYLPTSTVTTEILNKAGICTNQVEEPYFVNIWNKDLKQLLTTFADDDDGKWAAKLVRKVDAEDVNWMKKKLQKYAKEPESLRGERIKVLRRVLKDWNGLKDEL